MRLRKRSTRSSTLVGHFVAGTKATKFDTAKDKSAVSHETSDGPSKLQQALPSKTSAS